ncbi:Signal-transducing adaptor protein 2 [Dissostichus eleginoides]|uniref:Signal-transducing adaptor protein 2 n=1 Tax=Dissostichus eleginoides TaxID=100907 RepID=A0AAD9B900_DISEL|nr:Signal-transducing adaptor protein 2 [Dissostichus eleginoides]
MAAAPVRQRSGPGGPRAQLPPCYYEGYLEKRGPKEKASRRLWTCLCGNSLYFSITPRTAILWRSWTSVGLCP